MNDEIFAKALQRCVDAMRDAACHLTAPHRGERVPEREALEIAAYRADMVLRFREAGIELNTLPKGWFK